MPSLTDVLCTTCGLCCDGSLFADVELAGSDESSALELLGLEIEDADRESRGLLLQPCRALKGTRCSIYPHRPNCCRTFECRLLQQARRAEVTLEYAKAEITSARSQIAHIQSLIGALGPGGELLPLKERCAEALARSEAADIGAEAARKRNELEAAMTTLEQQLGRTFLDGSR
ncbi:MAG: YkgJ family cysteine cluster protein [Candidatus Eiseniibacteriota bacterium]